MDDKYKINAMNEWVAYCEVSWIIFVYLKLNAAFS